MTDLDIQIDVPDDDGLGEPVRVLNGSWVPPWLKAVGIAIACALLALLIGAFLAGRSRVDEAAVVIPPAVRSTELASRATSPAIESSVQAVQGWERFAQTGDLSALDGLFDPNGPQYLLLAQTDTGPDAAALNFAASGLVESADGVVTTVSMDLAVTGPDGHVTYPYDFVYLDGRDGVWTVVDRRAPGTAALPPGSEMIESAKASWQQFTSALSTGESHGVLDVVSDESVQLANHVAAAAGDSTPSSRSDETLVDADLFDVLVERARGASASTPGEALLTVLDAGQRQTVEVGVLTSWTQTDPDRIIASLEVAGEPVAIVPFVATTEGWEFDLVGALNTSGGTP